MPHAITPTTSFDAIEDEILFTRAALRADPDAKDLLPATDGWLSLLEPARAKDRACRESVANTTAARVIANGRLDASCAAFADDLFRAVGKDRSASRWTQFFSGSVTKFVRQALPKQVATVLGWLGGSKDPALEPHRAELDTWSKAASDAIVQTRGTALVRGEAHQAREELASELTRERNLPRDWADLFFVQQGRARRDRAAADDGTAPAPGDGAASA